MTDLDLDAVRARHAAATQAGEHADLLGWTTATREAVIRSWQDVAPLHDALKRAWQTLGDDPDAAHRVTLPDDWPTGNRLRMSREACTAAGGHCWVSTWRDPDTSQAREYPREHCKHCPATRTGHRQPSVVWSEP